MEHKYLRAYVIATLLLLSACTKTVYQTDPATQTQVNDKSTTSNSVIQDDPIADTKVPVNASLTNSVTTSTAVTATANTAEVNAAIAEAASNTSAPTYIPAVIGEPGEIVDCNSLLPCRWVDTDEDFTLTVGSVDNTGTLRRLSIQYTVNASHDSEIILGNGSTALAPGGAGFNLIQQSLGAGNGIVPLAVLAGEHTVGSATYDREAISDTLAGWTLTIIDNGLPRTVGFVNLPIGTSNSVAVDCADVLPCQWVSSRDDVTITLLAIGGYATSGRLNVNFNIVTIGAKDIVLDTGATAVSASGAQFDGRTHGLGIEQGFAKVYASTASGVMLPGNVSFFRTPLPPISLKSLDLVIYENIPIPRWNPQFINLPTQ